MARLPTPGGDVDAWASILNEYLLVAHNPDGTQKVESIPNRSVTMRDLDVKNNDTQDVSNLVLTNDNERLVWRSASEMARATTRLRINVTDFGAKGDGVTDDTAAIQAAIDSAENGGIIEIPRGTYMIRGLKVRKHGITITGEARFGTRLSRINGTEPLLDLSGTASMNGHLKFCSVTNIMLIGNYKPGLLIRSYYADNFIFRDVSFVHCDGTSLDFIEVWDTRFYNCTWENCGSLTQPATLFRNTMPVGQFGYSDDNTNQIHFLGCRWESWRNGAVRLDGGSNGSTRLLNGVFMVSCKMESRHAAGPALQIMQGTTIVFVNQLYVAIMAAEPDVIKPIDAIEDAGSFIYITDMYVQWGEEMKIANSLVRATRSGPHMYYKLASHYPAEDPIEAAVIADSSAGEVIISCTSVNRGRLARGNVSQVMIASPREGITLPLDASGTFKLTSNATNKDLLRFNNTGTRPAFLYANGVDSAGYSDNYATEKWRIVSSTGSARFAGNRFQIEGTKGYVGINSTASATTAMIVKPTASEDKGLTIARPTGGTANLLEFQSENNAVQGMGFDQYGRPVVEGDEPTVAPGSQAQSATIRTGGHDAAGGLKVIVRGAPTAPGPLAIVTFAKAYQNTPQFVALTDHSVTPGNLYVSARSTTSFTVSTRSTLAAGQVVNFDYAVIA